MVFIIIRCLKVNFKHLKTFDQENKRRFHLRSEVSHSELIKGDILYTNIRNITVHNYIIIVNMYSYT